MISAFELASLLLGLKIHSLPDLASTHRPFEVQSPSAVLYSTSYRNTHIGAPFRSWLKRAFASRRFLRKVDWCCVKTEARLTANQTTKHYMHELFLHTRCLFAAVQQ